MKILRKFVRSFQKVLSLLLLVLVTQLALPLNLPNTAIRAAVPGPVITNIASSKLTPTTATITWTTGVASDSQVHYGKDTTVGLTTVLDTALVTNHLVKITGLTPFTTYYYTVINYDANHVGTSSSKRSFKTPMAPSIYFIPHPDDEMFLAGAIREDLLSGRPVHVIVVTNGEVSDDLAARVNKLLTQQGYKPQSNAALTLARVPEITSSMATLGSGLTDKVDLHFGFREVFSPKSSSDSMTYEQATKIITYYSNKYDPDSVGKYSAVIAGAKPLYTGDYGSINVAHRIVFNALHDYRRDALKEKYYFADTNLYSTQTHVGISLYDTAWKYAYPIPNVVKKRITAVVYGNHTYNFLTNKTAAIASYKVWAPAKGRYALGYTSVPELINEFSVVCFEYIIKDSDNINFG